MPRTADKAEIRSILEKDRGWAIYALADLSPEHFQRCEWFVSTPQGRAIVLVYRAYALPILIAHGPREDLGPILDEAMVDPRIFCELHPGVPAMIPARYEILGPQPMWRMVLDPARFPKPSSRGAVRLRGEDAPAIHRLYEQWRRDDAIPNFFDARMLDSGVFYGIREGEEIVAAAGMHAVAPDEGVAAVGGIFTRPDRRGLGHATCTTAAVVAELIEMGIPTIGLNVAQSNAGAIRIYQRLGFRIHCGHIEGIAERAPPVVKGFAATGSP